jgi:hypothetical protein
MAWSDQAAKYLRGSSSCPRCERGPVNPDHCPYCGAILTGPIAGELTVVSAEAAELLDRRQEIIGRLTTKAEFAPPPVGMPSASPAPASTAATVAAPPTVVGPPIVGPPVAASAVPAPASSSQVSLQSVLAIAGAALFAVAIIVFRFYSQDVDVSVRRFVIAGVTVVFIGFAWLLARIKLTFSAEAVGALAMVFVALDIWAISELVPGNVSPWTFAAVSTLIAALLTLLIAVIVRLRTWLWLGLVALIFVPAFFGYAIDGPWSAVVGHLGSVAVALVGYEVARRLSPRFTSPLLADRVTVTIGAAVFGGVALLGLPAVQHLETTSWILGSALVMAVLAALCGLATRTLAPPAWSVAVGVLTVGAAAILPFALDLSEPAWLVALAPAAAVVAFAVVTLVPWPAVLRRLPLQVGALVVMLCAGLPAALYGLLQLLSPLAILSRAFTYGVLPPTDDPAVEPDFWFEPVRSASLFPAESGLAAIIGVAVVAVGVLVLAWSVRRDGGAWHPWLVFAAWLGSAALLFAPAWSALSRPGQTIAGILIALGIALTLILVPRFRGAALSLRVPPLVSAHGILLYLVAVSWQDDRLTVAAGIAIVAVLAVLAMAVSPVARPFYVVVGYGYALVLLARGLDLLGLDTIPVISYTATAASLFALAITLVRRVRAELWYAVLAVTAVPFVVGIVTVVAQRTWETALANAAIFALALTVTLTHRPGLTRFVRSGAAAILLPTLAVVVVNVVPQILETNIVPAWNGGGGAPVTLPIIATLVALVLPSTPLVADWLKRGDVPESDAASARVWIEISAFVTGGITALLALFLETPDLGTALVVFVILGIGGAGASLFAKRRFGWWIAAGSWTAALWCAWGLAGIADLEPYVYPPALAAVIIGIVLALRGRNGAALVGPGLAIAIVTSLIVLAASGSGPDAVLPWRALALLAASALLLAAGIVLSRGGDRWRLGILRMPVLIAAIGAASAGLIQAVRYAWELDAVGPGVSGATQTEFTVVPVLAYSLAAAILAALAGRFLLPAHRWALTPALLFLIVGPIAAVAPGVAPMWTLWGLSLALLALMLFTVQRDLNGTTILPPAWVTFIAAWCVAVAGWSVRDLNVEWFSLPLGLALTGAGVLVLLRGGGATGGTVTSWPVGFTRSWAVLAPGIVVTVLPSVLATGTNPATERAILVISLALAALLVGALLRYAAPFVLSLITFGVEIVVILFQLAFGRQIDPVLIYIVAGTAGTILIFVAIWFERRSRGDRENSARLRDLR